MSGRVTGQLLLYLSFFFCWHVFTYLRVLVNLYMSFILSVLYICLCRWCVILETWSYGPNCQSSTYTATQYYLHLLFPRLSRRSDLVVFYQLQSTDITASYSWQQYIGTSKCYYYPYPISRFLSRILYLRYNFFLSCCNAVCMRNFVTVFKYV